MPRIKYKHKQLAAIVLLGVALLWGGGYSASQLAINNGWSTYSILLSRSVIGGLVCLVLAIPSKFWKDKKIFLHAALTGMVFSVSYVLQLEGQRYTSIPNTSFLTTAGMVLAPVLATIFFKKKLNKFAVYACVLAIIAAAILSFDSKDFSINIGDALVMAGSIGYAFHILLVDRYAKRYNAIGFACIQLGVMAVISLGGVLITKSPFFGGAVGWWGVIYYALFSGVVCFVGQIWGQRNLPPGPASIIMSLEGLFATALAVIFFNSTLTWHIVVGGIIMLLAIIISQPPPKDILKKNVKAKKICKSDEEKDIIK